MSLDPNQFRSQAEAALADPELQQALAQASSGFAAKRRDAINLVSDFELLKHRAQQAKQKALAHLPNYLEAFENNVIQQGGQVHWAETPDQLNQIVLAICEQQQAQLVTKGKSMISEETQLNAFLEKHNIRVAETDLGEYIIQLAKERPSHIIAPAIHKTRFQVEDLFKQAHDLGARALGEIRALVDEARTMLRQDFLAADVGITGANLLVADTGSVVLVTNEGNGDLTATLPKVHIVTASIEKIVPDMASAADVLNVLARSATGQAMSAYTTFFNGPKRTDDHDGPEQFHVILLDNHRSELLGSKYQSMLSCIKCGACLNHCPVYQSVGGHAYGWVYPGPMGSVLTPLMTGLDQSIPLPNASTFCGRCEAVCPMEIPLPDLLRELRNDQFQQGLADNKSRILLRFHGWLLNRPKLYHGFNKMAVRGIHWLTSIGPLKGTIQKVLGKKMERQLPLPQDSKTFLSQWQNKNHDK